MGNFIEISKELNKAQYQTDEPEIFERILTNVFNYLGLNAKHLGGPNEPDIVVECNGEKVTVDTKTLRKNSGATEQVIGFPAQKRYKKKYNAYKAAVVAASFRKGNVLETAREEGVILIETKAICQLLYNHNISPYTSGEIFGSLFKGGRVMVSSEQIKSSLEENKKRMVEIIRDLVDILEKRKGQPAKFTLEKLQDIFTYGRDKDYKNEDIELALELLLRLNILKEENQEYELTRDISGILEDINILALARGIIEQPLYPRKGEIIKPYGEVKKSSRKSLDHILEVVKLLNEGYDFSKAARKVVADGKCNVDVSTVRAACTTRFGISTAKFKELFKSKKLEQFLKEQFPEDTQAITEVFR
ncbi:MAG: hypothetical protein ACTSU6_06285 [Candidatus Njordarchaeales archaeon]